MIKGIFYSLLLGICLFVIQSSAFAVESYDEYQLKAAITYNVAKFVKWPEGVFADGEAPLTICVLGNHNTASGFASLEGQLLGGRHILVKYLKSPSDFKSGHIFFVARSRSRQLAEILLKLEGLPILTISDMKSFATRGGMINLVERGKRIRFAINLDASMAANLQVSSKLYSLATEVIRDGQ